MTTPVFITPYPLKTAVLFLVFNRPNTTKQVFEAIRKAKPPRLYVAADGPRHGKEGETKKVQAVRNYVTANSDWNCQVKTLFRDKNLGCKYAVSGAISWFFEQEEMGIILEDDCLPHPDFFCFCETLLARYADNAQIAVITGNNFQDGHQRGSASYYFSKYNHCWGWATWRRAWQNYQGTLAFWPEWQNSDDWRAKIPDPVERKYFKRIFDRVYANEIDSWAYPWTASVWYQGGLTATPNMNLVSNVGFGAGATHTTSGSSNLANLPVKGVGELRYPEHIIQDKTADRFVFDNALGGRNLRFPFSLLRLPRRVASAIYHRLKKGFI